MAEDLAATRVLAATVLVNLGLVGIVGAWASVLWLRHADSAWATRARRGSWTTLRAALAVTAGADGLLLWFQAAAMGGMALPAALRMLPSLLTTSYVGQAWAGGMAGLALVLAGVAGKATEQRNARLAGVGLGVSLFVYGRAAVSHAGNFGLTSPQLLVESLHLGAISVWLGGVGIAAFVVLSEKSALVADERADVSRWVRALSTAATGALMVIVATGLFNAWRGVESAANLVGSAYGETLLVKLAFVAIAVLLGGLNRFRGMPRLLTALQSPHGSPAPSQQRFVQILRIEALFLFAALVAAAVLSSSPLPPAT